MSLAGNVTAIVRTNGSNEPGLKSLGGSYKSEETNTLSNKGSKWFYEEEDDKGARGDSMAKIFNNFTQRAQRSDLPVVRRYLDLFRRGMSRVHQRFA